MNTNPELPIPDRRLGLWGGFALGWFCGVILSSVFINLV